ncbi:OLC1v1030795C1 [Oldenlandia corymbosa var. corymbosa]|uniref:OLC1v1030795C1 n=1 Tax=Oldenlandia corymbosa var. corymbosa TaxID=529605 RepID=A0AAV1CHP5_OLDCO|nr:OLC1v1030795C1 [Oldenlandia corymbosa var. corymbosa]
MATRNLDLKTVQDFASTINSDDRVKAIRTRYDLPVELDVKAPLVMSSSNAGSRLYGDEDPFPIVNSDEEESTTVVAGAKKKRKRLMKVSEKEKKKKADAVASKSTAQGENIVPPTMEKTNAPPGTKKATLPKWRQNQAINHLPWTKGRALSRRKQRSWLPMMLSLGGMAAAIQEVNLVATEYGAHKVAVAGLKRLNGDRPINQVEALCEALVKMGTPENMAMFACDPATVLSKGPSEEEPIPEVPDEYISIELEEEDYEASREDVADTGNWGVQKNVRETSQSHP